MSVASGVSRDPKRLLLDPQRARRVPRENNLSSDPREMELGNRRTWDRGPGFISFIRAQSVRPESMLSTRLRHWTFAMQMSTAITALLENTQVYLALLRRTTARRAQH